MDFPKKLFKLNEYMQFLDARCPVGRHELTEREWLALGALTRTRAELEMEEQKARQAAQGEHGH